MRKAFTGRADVIQESMRLANQTTYTLADALNLSQALIHRITRATGPTTLASAIEVVNFLNQHGGDVTLTDVWISERDRVAAGIVLGWND